MSAHIITISREFGSGGRTIGRKLGEKLGIPCYDKEFIKQIADKTGLSPDFVQENGEHAPTSSIFAYSPNMYQYQNGGMSVYDVMYAMQRRIILDLAGKGPCIIIGRCSDYILRDHPDAIHAFIYASQEYKAERIVKLYGETEKSPEDRLKEKDKKRAINYKHFTGQTWGDRENYDLLLDSGKLGIDQCVEILASLYQA